MDKIQPVQGFSIYEEKKLCYNKIQDEVKKNMSFVGFIRCIDGILAFGDTKGTRDKFQPESEARGKIKKVFQNEHLILVTFGNNEIGFEQKPIEIIIEDLILKKQLDAFSFIKIFTDILTQKNDQREFNFLVYNKKTDSFHELFFKESNSKYNAITKNYISRGVLFYQNTFEELNMTQYFIKQSLKECKEHFNYIYSKLIKQLDETGFYNAVGLPFYFEEYYYKED